MVGLLRPTVSENCFNSLNAFNIFLCFTSMLTTFFLWILMISSEHLIIVRPPSNFLMLSSILLRLGLYLFLLSFIYFNKSSSILLSMFSFCCFWFCFELIIKSTIFNFWFAIRKHSKPQMMIKTRAKKTKNFFIFTCFLQEFICEIPGVGYSSKILSSVFSRTLHLLILLAFYQGK